MNINELLLDFRITSRCDMACDLCFRNPGIEDKSLVEIKDIISKMHRIGFRRIGFTGGEPTIREDYLEMIRYAKNLGFLTYLSTVGKKFIAHLDILDGILDWVGLPIDGINPNTNAVVRSYAMRNQHETIQDIFTQLSSRSTFIKVKLTTVVTKANVEELESTINFVKNLPYYFETWRFYQFCPLGVGKIKEDKLTIETSDFIDKMNFLKRKFCDLPIGWATFEERDKANIVMEPNFDVIIPDGSKYSYLCNMEKDNDSFIFSKIGDQEDILKKCENNRCWIY